jgi:hypothetical protein
MNPAAKPKAMLSFFEKVKIPPDLPLKKAGECYYSPFRKGG